MKEIVPVSIEEVKLLLAKQKHLFGTMLNTDGLCMHDRQIWIPTKANDVKLRIILEAHCKDQVHRAYDATPEIVQRTY